MSTLARPAPRAPTRMRVGWARFRLRHPEWGLVAASAVAWMILLLWMPAGAPALSGGPSGAPASHHGGPVTWAWLNLLIMSVLWLLMVVAMMGPVMVPRVRTVAHRCPGRVRARAIAETLTGALLVWMPVGVAVAAVMLVLPPLDASHALLGFVVLWVAAALWQLSPVKRVSLRRCHSVRLSLGAGTQSQVRAGAVYAGWCVASCGPAMAVMALTGHSLVFMAVLTAGFTAERVARRPERASALLALAIAGATAAFAVAGLVA